MLHPDPTRLPLVVRYAIGLGAAAVALGLRLALNPWLGAGTFPFFSLFFALLFVGWYAGVGPALLTLVAGAFGAHFLLLADHESAPVMVRGEFSTLLIYASVGGICIALGYLLSRATQQAAEHARAAQAKETRLELLSNTIPALVSYVDRDRRYRSCNRAYTLWFGLEQDQVVGRPMQEVLGDDAWKIIGPRIDRAFAGETVEYEDRVKYRHGDPRWIHAVYTPHREGGEVVGVVVLATDVTSARHAEQALRSSEERFRTFMDNSPARAWLKDDAGRYVFANRALLAGLRRELHEVIGRTDAEIFAAAEAEQYRRNDQTVLHTQAAVQVTETSMQPDGEHYYLSVKFPLRDDEGRRYIGGKALDVTRQRRAEDALREADRRKDEFLAILAHELRNPLAPVRTGLELLRIAGHEPGLLEQVRPMMERQVAHMVRLLDDLLDVSRITTGRIELQRQPTPVSELMQGAIEANRAAIDAAGLTLALTLPPSEVRVDVDPTRLVQVLSNLLHNATKFTPRGGRIDVAARLDADPARGGGPDVVIDVRDTGIGIDATTLPHVFDLFVQGTRAPGHGAQGNGAHGNGGGQAATGLGIGLALVRQLVELHGGSIRVASEGTGRGTAFTLRLPALPPAADAPGTGRREARPTRIARRVLVIDDNHDAADTLAALVRTLGGEAHVSYDGADGLRAAASQQPDVVLLDIGMPGMDGYEVCRRLRTQPCGSGMSIVALTGWGQQDDVRRALHSGFDAHVTKPADPEALHRLLAEPPKRRGGDADPAARPTA